MVFNVCGIPRYDHNQSRGKACRQTVDAVPQSSVWIAYSDKALRCAECENKMEV